jgi:hypothetical protein
MRAKEFITENALDEMALPNDWDESALGHGKTFANRVAYAKERAAKLGTGSSRVAFTVEDGGRPTALKIAKNKKGLAQNEAEVEILNDNYVKNLGIVIPIIDYDKKNPQPTWVQTEVAKKASESALCKIMKCGKTLFHLTGYTEMLLGNPNSWEAKQAYAHMKTLSDDDAGIFQEYGQRLAELISSTSLQPGDFSRAQNWGLYNGNPVIIDVGYTETVKDMYWNLSK